MHNGRSSEGAALAALAVVMATSGVSDGCPSCGGIHPYIPTQSGGGAAGANFFLIEKGTSYDMFDGSRLQPILRNIVISGNERRPRASHDGQEDAARAGETQEAEADSSQLDEEEEAQARPVLDLIRLY